MRKRYDIAGTVDRSAGQFPEILVREINAAAEASRRCCSGTADDDSSASRRSPPSSHGWTRVGSFTVARNETAPAAVGDGGHVVVRDGDARQRRPDARHRQLLGHASRRVEAIAGGADPDGALDALLVAIEQALLAEPTLGGWSSPARLRPDRDRDAQPATAPSLKSALIDVVIEYETINPWTRSTRPWPSLARPAPTPG